MKMGLRHNTRVIDEKKLIWHTTLQRLQDKKKKNFSAYASVIKK